MSSISLKNVGIFRDEYHAMVATARRAPFVRQHRIYRTLYIVSSDDRSSDRLIDMCAGAGIAFIPWYPLAAGRLASPDSPLVRIAQRLGATPSQITLALASAAFRISHLGRFA